MGKPIKVRHELVGRAVGYARVSTDGQAKSGLGLEAQREALESAAKRLGLELVSVHSDAGLSGALALADRPELLDAVAELRRGDVLLVAKRDRLGRDPIEVAMIERLVQKKGARIASALEDGTNGDDPTSVLMRRMLDAFAEFERLLGSARTKAALRAKRARGERSGSIPFGFELGPGTDDKDDPEYKKRKLQTLAHEQEARRHMLRLRAGGASLQEIANWLTKHGHKPRGTRWHPESVRVILKTAAREKEEGR